MSENERDVEDGEILSEEEPISGSNPPKQVESPFGNYEMIQRAATSVPGGQQFRQVRAEEIQYSSEDEGASESDEDSPDRKRMMTVKQSGSRLGHGHARDGNWVKEKYQDVVNTKGKKWNNVWGSVLQEESISKCVDSLNRNEQVDYNERGAESYDWTRSKLDPRYVNKDTSGQSDDSSGSESSSENQEAAPDLTEIECFASAVEKPKISIKSRLGKRSKRRGHFKKSNEMDSDDESVDRGGDEKEIASNAEKEVRDVREKITGKVKDKGEAGGEGTGCGQTDGQSMDNDYGARKIFNMKQPEYEPHDTFETKEVKTDQSKSTKCEGFDARQFLQSKQSKSKRNDAREEINERKRKRERRRGHPMSWKDRMDDIMEVEVIPMKMGVHVDDTMDTALLADTIVDALREPQDKLELFMRVVEELGAEKTIKLFKETKDIEGMGGLMINSRQRRRTPGGVFLWLLRRDATEEQASAIFGDARKEYEKKCKEWKRERRRRARERKQASWTQLGQMEETPKHEQSEPTKTESESKCHSETNNDMDDLDLEDDPEISIDFA